MLREVEFERAREILEEAVARRAFPAAAFEVGSTAHVLQRSALGALTFDADAAPARVSTVFDLASLTKVIATAVIAMRLIDEHRLALDDHVARWLPDWRGGDREDVTIRDLLAHCSGLPAHLKLYETCTGREEFSRAICGWELEYEPRTQSVYSDLGFMLLGFILEDVAGTPLPRAFEQIVLAPEDSFLGFAPPGRALRGLPGGIAPTGVDAWRGRMLVGEVHDGNCWALGGSAGHAGLFGDVAAVGAFARSVLRSLRSESSSLARADTVQRFATRTDVPGSTRALAWDTMKPSSSCGRRMHPTAIGHTGFTGTSLWIDWERDLYIVLLTNRVYPDSANDAILTVRPAFHDAVVATLSGEV